MTAMNAQVLIRVVISLVKSRLGRIIELSTRLQNFYADLVDPL